MHHKIIENYNLIFKNYRHNKTKTLNYELKKKTQLKSFKNWIMVFNLIQDHKTIKNMWLLNCS